jgi:hypothetical protein
MYVVGIMKKICMLQLQVHTVTISFKGLYVLGVRAKYYHCDCIWFHNYRCNTQNFSTSGGGADPVTVYNSFFILKIML